jgi:hypothetical protein
MHSHVTLIYFLTISVLFLPLQLYKQRTKREGKYQVSEGRGGRRRREVQGAPPRGLTPLAILRGRNSMPDGSVCFFLYMTAQPQERLSHPFGNHKNKYLAKNIILKMYQD